MKILLLLVLVGHDTTNDKMLWPVGGVVTSSFGPRWGRHHDGVDIGAEVGTPVRSAYAGVVIWAGRYGAYGRMVAVLHRDGNKTFYAHLRSYAVVEQQLVQVGQLLGWVGLTGRTTGPHLHFETHINGHPVDPLMYLLPMSEKKETSYGVGGP
jgi:murein DD-endopeptidase MepM/ murein hydrolase activator NlpD